MAEPSASPSAYAAEAEALVDAMAERERLSSAEERAARRCIDAGEITAALVIVTRNADTDRAG